MKKRVLVGLSGGVDSAVSAYLLMKEGYEVSVGFMKNYTSDSPTCTTMIDRDEAIKVAQYLGIKIFSIFDFREEYDKAVVQYIYEGYKKGITPNPDIMCNKEIKFRLFLDYAIKNNYDYIATGHYARINKDDNGVYHLLKGVDPNKDQSYFLAGLNQEQLSKSIFPIGHLQKDEVRQIASRVGLPNATRKDSQGICFVGKVNMKDFLSQNIEKKIGNIVDTKGNIIGQHEGAYYYTIGQRKGICVGGGPALFVVKKDVDKNEIVVGNEAELELYSTSLTASNFNFIANSIKFPFEAKCKIRYRQEDQDCIVDKLSPSNIKVSFAKSQRAITSGQIIAIYNNDELIAQAIID